MKKILFLGLLAFLLSAVWLLPLSFAKPYIKQYVPQLSLGNVKGTVWQGSSDQLTFNNIDYGKANWQVKPFESLTSLSLKTEFQLTGNEIKANGLAAITPAQTIKLTNTEFDVDASFASRFQKNAKLTGSFVGSVKQAELKNKTIPLIDGIIDWKEGAVTSPIKLDRGDYRALLIPTTQGLDIKLSSNDAPIELNGDIKLNKDWKYETNINAKGVNQGISAMLRFAGKPQNDGSTLIQQKGDLSPFIGL